jgi:hypothetical protein
VLTVDLSRVEGAEQSINVGSFLAASPFIRHVQGLALRRHGDEYSCLSRQGNTNPGHYARHFAIPLLKMGVCVEDGGIHWYVYTRVARLRFSHDRPPVRMLVADLADCLLYQLVSDYEYSMICFRTHILRSLYLFVLANSHNRIVTQCTGIQVSGQKPLSGVKGCTFPWAGAGG